MSAEASLAAPPVDGAANAELIALLSEALAVPKSALRIVLGDSAKNKVVEVSALSGEEAAARLAAAAGERR